MAWFKICRFRVAPVHRNPVLLGPDFISQLEACLVSEAAGLARSGPPGLERSQTQQCQPMGMRLTHHYFPWAFTLTLRALAAHEAPMVQKELQQV